MRLFLGSMLALVLSIAWLLGPDNVSAWFENQGENLNPNQQVHIYRGSSSQPAVLPNVVVGTWNTFTFEGAVQVNTAPAATRCVYSSGKVLVSNGAFGVYGSRTVDTVTVLMIRAGEVCPNRAPQPAPEANDSPYEYVGFKI